MASSAQQNATPGMFVGHRGLGSVPMPSFAPLTTEGRTFAASAVQSAADAVRGLPYITPQTSHGPGVRYGSGAGRSSTPRGRSARRPNDRSRDRDGGDRPVSTTSLASARQMGEQETLDWDEVFDNLVSRVSALENLSKQKDNQIKELLGQVESASEMVLTTTTDIAAYKTWVNARFTHFDTVATEQIVDMKGSIKKIGDNFMMVETRFQFIENAQSEADARLASIAMMVEELRVGRNAGPSYYSMGTPMPEIARGNAATAPPPPPPPGMEPRQHQGLNDQVLSPFDEHQDLMRYGAPSPANIPHPPFGCAAPQAPIQPQYGFTEPPTAYQQQQQAPPVPPTWNQGAAQNPSHGMSAPGAPVHSPFDEHRNQYPTTPARPTTGLHGNDPWSKFSPSHPKHNVDGRFDLHGVGLPHSSVNQSPESWEPSYKENKELHKFDSTMTNYDEWAQSIKDHLCRTNRSWEQLLEWVGPLPQPLLYDRLCSWHVGGVNGWLI